jgi:hypothetical protein
LWHNTESLNSKTFFGELKRRNVYKVAAAYAVIAWLLFQTALTLLPGIEAPAWLMPGFVIFLALGFAWALYISWAFEATPQGLKRTAKVSPAEVQALPTWSTRKFTVFIVMVALLAASLLVFDLLRSKPASPPSTAAPEQPSDTP